VTKNGSLNSLADLLGLAYTVEDPHDTSKAIYALYRVFVVIISNKKLDLSGDEAAKVVKAWIWERFQSYIDFLGSLLQDEEKFLRVSDVPYCQYVRLKLFLLDFITADYVFFAKTSFVVLYEVFPNFSATISFFSFPKNCVSSSPLSTVSPKLVFLTRWPSEF
jgi:hypothetical protein